MRPVTTTVTGVAASNAIPLDYQGSDPLVSIQVTISATATYTVQATLDDVWAGAPTNWFSVPTAALVAATTNQLATQTGLYTALRINVTASTGTVTMKLVTATGTAA